MWRWPIIILHWCYVPNAGCSLWVNKSVMFESDFKYSKLHSCFEMLLELSLFSLSQKRRCFVSVLFCFSCSKISKNLKLDSLWAHLCVNCTISVRIPECYCLKRNRYCFLKFYWWRHWLYQLVSLSSK